MKLQHPVLLMTFFFAGCQGGGDMRGATTVRDSLGLRITLTNARVIETSPVLASVTDTLVQVGNPDDHPGSEALFRVAGALLFEDGSFVVLQGGSELRFYDPEGRRVSTVGQRGEGPGEYSLATGLRRTESGDIAVWDAQLGRVSVLSRRGDFIRSQTANMEQLGRAFPILMQIRPQSRWELIDAERLLVFDYSFAEMPAKGFARPRVRYIIWGLDGTGADTLGEYGGIEQTSVPRLNRVVVPTLDPEDTYFAVSEHSKDVYVGDGGTDHVDRYDAAGALDLRIDLKDVNRAPDAQVVAEAKGRLLEELHRRGLESVEGPVDDMATHEDSPTFRGLATDDRDRVWVRWGQQPDPSRVLYAVFDSTGMFVGRVLLPPHERILAISSDRLLLLHRSPRDVETLGVYRIRQLSV